MTKIISVVILAALVLPGVVSAQSGRRRMQTEQSTHLADSLARRDATSRIAGASDRERSAGAEGLSAPNFTLTDLQGRRVSLESLRGKVVLLNFWATWCPYCVEDLPVIEQLQREFKNQGLVVLAINVEDAETARGFMQRNGYTFTTLVDADNQAAQLYDIEALPTVFIIGRDGEIVKRMVGAKNKSTLSGAIALAGIKTSSRDA